MKKKKTGRNGTVSLECRGFSIPRQLMGFFYVNSFQQQPANNSGTKFFPHQKFNTPLLRLKKYPLQCDQSLQKKIKDELSLPFKSYKIKECFDFKLLRAWWWTWRGTRMWTWTRLGAGTRAGTWTRFRTAVVFGFVLSFATSTIFIFLSSTAIIVNFAIPFLFSTSFISLFLSVIVTFLFFRTILFNRHTVAIIFSVILGTLATWTASITASISALIATFAATAGPITLQV